MFDEIDFLVQETYKDAEKPKFGRGFINNFFGYKEDLDIPESSGVFYHLQKKSSTFVIRIHPSKDLKSEYKNISKHPDMYPALRLNESEQSLDEKIKFFECDRFQIAQKIKVQLGNKRFPMYEERIFNVSDPGDSWWLKLDENSIQILFKLSHGEETKNLIKLGPLGEPDRTQHLLQQLYGYFKMIFPVEDYFCGHSRWGVTCNEINNPNFEYLKQLLSNGETSHDFWNFLRQLESNAQQPDVLESLQKANYFLMELSCIRSFWRSIQDEL